MTPISLLPAAGTYDGSEQLPMVQRGVTVRGDLSLLADFGLPPFPLTVSQGGTGTSLMTVGAVLLGNGANQITQSVGGSGQLLMGSGAAPTWLTPGPSGYVLASAGPGQPLWWANSLPGAIGDAPVDAYAYMRSAGGWSSGGTLSGDLILKGANPPPAAGAYTKSVYTPAVNLPTGANVQWNGYINAAGNAFLTQGGAAAAIGFGGGSIYSSTYSASATPDSPTTLTARTILGGGQFQMDPTTSLILAHPATLPLEAAALQQVPLPASAPPIMDGTAAVGTSALFARQDHVHPTDTSRYAASNPAGYISGNQTITLSGDVAGTGATAITTTLASSGVAAGSYTQANITVDSKGRVTAASSGAQPPPAVTVGDTPPTTPIGGQLWFDSTGLTLYTWYNDGTSSQWTPASPGSGGAVTISATPPSNPVNGQMWWDNVGGQMYVWYVDPNTAQWVPIVNQGGAYLPLAGGQLTGPLTLSADATANLQPTTLQQVTASLGGYLPLSGGTLTGTLNGTAANFSGALTVSGGATIVSFVTVQGGAGATCQMSAPAGNPRQIALYTGANATGAGLRWLWQFANTSAESGSNAGSDMGVFRYNDAGAQIGVGVLGITRATGLVSMNYGLNVANANATNVAMTVANAGINYSALPNGGFPVGFTWTGSLCQLYVNNTLIGTLNVTSDARLKRNVKKAKEDALATLKKIALYSFDVNYRTHEDDPDVHVPIGFTAQQLREAGAADAVHEGKVGTDKDDTRLTLDLMPLLARCVRAIQQLSEKVEALEARLGRA